jgi:hypothetical protein
MTDANGGRITDRLPQIGMLFATTGRSSDATLGDRSEVGNERPAREMYEGNDRRDHTSYEIDLHDRC